MNDIIVSFITINYNGYNDTCELIDSIQQTISQVSYEIIVIDNASVKNEALLLQERYPSVIVIKSFKNLGFSGGNNLGIKKSQGDFLFLINNDTFITEDKIVKLINRFKSNHKIGGISPKIKFATTPHNIQYAGFTPLSPITLRNHTIGLNMADNGQYDRPLKTPYLHGAAMMIKREVVDKIGLMPEIYFLYYEELDWSTRITQAGYELWYDPQWCIYHKESITTGSESPLKIFYITRNRLLYAWRNLSFPNRHLSILYQIIIASNKNIFISIFKKRIDLCIATLQGIFEFFRLSNKNQN